MPSNEDQRSKIKFDHDWRACCLHSTDEVDINTMTNTNSGNDQYWISIQLPHIIVNNQQETNQTTTDNEENWWYRKQFEWKICRQNSKQQFHLMFESLDDHYSPIDTFTIWLNEIQIFSDTFQSPNMSIDITKQLIYKDESENNNSTNTIVICCKNTSLCLHTNLLLPTDMIYAIDQDNNEVRREKFCTTLSYRKNRVLDYLVSFSDDDGRFDIILNPKLQSPSTISKAKNLPNIVVSEDHSQTNEQNIENNDEFHVPRLAIVMLIVGTRGDVQPFVAFGQTLLAAGHRVRLATHEKFRKFVREHGLEFFPIASNPDDLMSFMVKNDGVVPSMSSIVAGDLKKQRRDIAAILKSTWLACTENDDETSAPFTAEVIIANPPSFGHVHCAQKLQIPLHIMFTMPWSATTVFPHAFCRTDHGKVPIEKLNLLSYSAIDTLTWSSMRDLANDFRREILDLPPLHTRQGVRVLWDENVPHTYCWSPALVPKPFDWPSHINVAGYFFLNNDNKQYEPPKDLVAFLGLNNENQDEVNLPPPMYIGFGSITGWDSRRLLKVVLAALTRTGYRAVLAGFEKNNDQLPDNVFKVGDVPHDWLFQHVSAVCHHGGAGTTAAGLRAGKPTIVLPFFGDQFFWGNVVAKNGAGPLPIPGKHITVDELVEAFKMVHEPKLQAAAKAIREVLAHENGCKTALRLFHTQLPLSRMRSDLELTFPACYRIDKFDLQVSRPVAQVLIAAGALDESDFRPHATQEWKSIYDHRVHVPTSGAIKHAHKAFSHIFLGSPSSIRRAVSSTNLASGLLDGAGGACKHIGKGVGHISLGAISLYGELTDVLDRVPSLYDPYKDLDAHERPRVTDFKSGVKAARLSVLHGWKDGITGFVRKPRVGYHRNGILGGATGALVATANGIIKPAVGSLASVTWLGRGMYASAQKKRRKKNKKGDHRIINKHSLQSPLLSSTSEDDHEEHDDDENNDDDEDNDDDDDDVDVPTNIKFAAVVSGYPTAVCQQIIDEFEKVKKHQEQIAALSPTQKEKRRRRDLFQRHRSYSDSAL